MQKQRNLKHSKRIISILIIVILLALSVAPYTATALTTIDTTRKCSLTLYAYNTGEDDSVFGNYEGFPTAVLQSMGYTPIQGVRFRITRVTDTNFTNKLGETYYTKEGIALPTVNEVKTDLNGNQTRFKNYASYSMAPTDSSGRTILTNLAQGIYFVTVLSTPDNVKERADDFIISLPYSYDYSWQYEVSLIPKFKQGVILTYDSNNGSGTTTSEIRYPDKTEPLTENSFSNGSKTFLGWADSASAIAPDYFDEQDFTMPNQNKTIYAVWAQTSAMRYYTAFKYSEPWGLKLSIALVNPNTNAVINSSLYNNYGIYILRKNTAGNSTPTMADMIKYGKLYSNTNTTYTLTDLTFNDGKTDSYPTMTYDKDIYTQNLKDDIFTLTYITYKGRTFWGTIKNRAVENSVESIIQSQAIGLTSFTDAEVRLATAIKNMYDAEHTYYLNQEGEIPTFPKGKTTNDLTSYTLSPFPNYVYSTSLNALGPWRLRIQATSKYGVTGENGGVVVYIDTKKELLEKYNNNTLTYQDILDKPGAKYYSSINGTAEVSEGTLSNIKATQITAYTDEIPTYRLGQYDVYTCFYVIRDSDGKPYIDKPRRRNCLELAQQGKTDSSGNKVTYDVFDSMINLYNETYYYKYGSYPSP